MMEWVPPAV
jgi:hypothetical protein